MTTNINYETGIRFGVIALNNLDGDLQQQLMYGANVENVSFKLAYAEAESVATREAADEASERGFVHGSRDWEDLIEQRVESALDQFNNAYESHEDIYIGTFEGVKYQIGWLGGAPLLWVLHSPHVVAVASLCSPCVPNAGNLDSGLDPNGYECYGIPEDWVAEHARHVDPSQMELEGLK